MNAHKNPRTLVTLAVVGVAMLLAVAVAPRADAQVKVIAVPGHWPGEAKTRVQKLERDNDRLERENAALRRQVAALERENQALRRDNTAKDRTIRDLETRLRNTHTVVPGKPGTVFKPATPAPRGPATPAPGPVRR